MRQDGGEGPVGNGVAHGGGDVPGRPRRGGSGRGPRGLAGGHPEPATWPRDDPATPQVSCTLCKVCACVSFTFEDIQVISIMFLEHFGNTETNLETGYFVNYRSIVGSNVC